MRMALFFCKQIGRGLCVSAFRGAEIVSWSTQHPSNSQRRLNSANMNILPTQIGLLSALTALSLTYNQLTVVPTEIGRCTQIRELLLANNRIRFFPSEIGRLRDLNWLSLSRNKLESLPSEMSRLKKLFNFYIYGNNLVGLDFPLDVIPRGECQAQGVYQRNIESNCFRNCPG